MLKNTLCLFFSLWALVGCQSLPSFEKETTPVEKKEVKSPDHREFNPDFKEDGSCSFVSFLGLDSEIMKALVSFNKKREN